MTSDYSDKYVPPNELLEQLSRDAEDSLYRDSESLNVDSFRVKPLTPTLLASLHECEMRYVLHGKKTRRTTSKEALRGIRLHSIRESFLRNSLNKEDTQE